MLHRTKYIIRAGINKFKFILLIVCIVFQMANPQIVFGANNDATVEVLGGGGGGGVVANNAGGGGGGGEYRRCIETLSVQSYTVTVGTGGTIDTANKTDSTFSGTGITLTAIGGLGTTGTGAGTGGTGGVSTNCDTAVANFNGGTPGAGIAADYGGGAGGGAGYGGKGGNGATAVATNGGGGGGGGGETGAGGNAGVPTAGTGGTGGGGAGGAGGAGENNGATGSAGTPSTYQIVGGGGGGGSGGTTSRVGGACAAPGGGSGGGEATGAGNGCRGEVRIIYVDSEISATGGTETTSGIYRIHTFTTSGTFTVSSITEAAPTVTTDFASNVGATLATLNGTKTGGDNAVQHGFAWGTLPGLNGGDTATTTLGTKTSNTPFLSGITGLTANTTYYFRAYASSTAALIGFGVIRSFFTGNTTVTRKMRLFEGGKIKLLNNKLILHQQ